MDKSGEILPGFRPIPFLSSMLRKSDRPLEDIWFFSHYNIALETGGCSRMLGASKCSNTLDIVNYITKSFATFAISRRIVQLHLYVTV